MNENGSHSAEDLPSPESNERITVPSAKILGHLATLGDVAVLREVPDAQRLIVCVKQDHGSVPEHREWVQRNESEKIQGWIRHQNEINRIGLETEKLHHAKVQYFIENFADGRNIPVTPMSVREEQEKVFRRASSNANVAMNLAKSVTQSRPGIDNEYLQSQMGMSRLMFNLVAQDPSAASRIHGLEYPTRRQYVETRAALRTLGDIAGLRVASAEDFQRLNAHAIAQVNTHAGPGSCAMIILGGNHFETYTDMDQLRRYGDTPRNIEEVMLDTVMLREGSLSDSTIAVLKPKNFPK